MRGCTGPDDRLALGHAGEEAAAAELERRGYRVIERNWRCRLGEIDLIAIHGDVLVFVEVKARRSASFGVPAEAVDRRKSARLANLARAYISARPSLCRGRACRFDVVAVTFARSGSTTVEVIQDAFSVQA